jgi:hypothetical protein
MFRATCISPRSNRLLVLSCLILVLSGCVGPSQQIQQGKDLSTSGIQYANAVNGLLDVTIDRVIDFDSTEALKIRKRMLEEMLKESIQERDSALLDLIKELNSMRRYTQQLKIYFLNLQSLANSPLQEETGSAVLELSESIEASNKKIKEKATIKLSNKEKEGIAALSQSVAKGVHAAKINAALRRDAKVISEQLLLQEKLLDILTEMLVDRFNIENDEFRNLKVIGPYTKKQVKIGEQWKKDRKSWLKSQFTIESLNKAKEASRQLRSVWEQILQGRSDPASITLLLQDINEFVLIVNKINEANESKGGS